MAPPVRPHPAMLPAARFLRRAAHDGRPDPHAEAARTQTRLDQLEAMTRRLQTPMDGLAESQAHVVAQAEARAEGARMDVTVRANQLKDVGSVRVG